MSERAVLITLQVVFTLLQISAAVLAIMVDPRFAALGPIIGGFQSKWPDPFAKP